jgi:hypothetical protein
MARARRGVYVLAGMAPTYEQAVLAAVLASGHGAFASHLTAAWLRHLVLPIDEPPMIEITTALTRRPRIEGVRFHRSGLLLPDDVTEWRGIAMASVERTIVDCSGRSSVAELGKMTDDAIRRRLTTIELVADTAERLPSAPGRSPAKMRKMLARRLPDVSERESVLEDFVFDALRRYGLPLPKPQHWVRFSGKRRRIDLCYVDEMLALEACGFEFRRSRSRFDDEALRGNELQLLGYRVLEFTSAFTDREIAEHVAQALGLSLKAPQRRPMSFEAWLAHR